MICNKFFVICLRLGIIMPIIVNHVLSKNMYSKIFEAIFRYIQNYSNPDEVKHIFTTRPIENADIYHYHRPNLEDEFFANSFSTVHHDLHDTDGWLGMEKFINAYKQMAKIICLNKTQQAILQEFGIEHTTVIPWGYNENIFSPKPLETDNNNSKKCLGIFSKRYGRKVKGEALLYEIAKRLPNDAFKFMLVGEGRSEDAHFLEKLGFEVEVFEYLPYNLFDDLYNKIDALLITSFFEGGPANVPEAFAKGIPIISTPVGFAKDYIEHGVNGILLDFDVETDVVKILEILNQPFYLNLRKNALEMRNQILTWQQVVESYNQQYLEYYIDHSK